MKKMVLSSAFLLPALVGCGKAGAPECGDEMTLDLVRSIIQRELGAASAAANLSTEQLRSVLPISLAHPTSFDEKISRYSCEADLAAPFNNPGQDVYKLRLEYTSQAVNGQHLARSRCFLEILLASERLSAPMSGAKHKPWLRSCGPSGRVTGSGR